VSVEDVPTRVRYFVHLACFCETATLSETKVLSLGSIVGQIVLTPPPQEPFTISSTNRLVPAVVVVLQFVLSVTPSPQGYRHNRRFDLEFVTPDGSVTGKGTLPMDFKKGEGNGLAIVNAQLALSQTGLHWMNVRLRKSLLTSVALNVVVVQPDQLETNSGGAPGQSPESTSRPKASSRKPRSDPRRTPRPRPEPLG
jgi:hypothetical protein